METLRLIRKKFPDIILCLASNGLAIGPYIEELACYDISHVTITVNTVDPEIGQKIYGWVRDGKVVYRGMKGASLLLERQLSAIRMLKKKGIVVKVNTIVIPGINDDHIEQVARRMKGLGVDLLNCMAMFPNVGTPFAEVPQPGKETMAAIRNMAERYLPQMRHCTRCRADAVGLLGDDKTHEFRGCLSSCAKMPVNPSDHRPFIAVATMEGVLINQHLGEAYKFQIWGQGKDGYHMVEERPAPEPGGGIKRWMKLARILHDCQAILTSGIGETPREILSKSGIRPLEMSGFIEDGLEAVFSGENLDRFRARRNPCAQGGCGGTGGGCL